MNIVSVDRRNLERTREELSRLRGPLRTEAAQAVFRKRPPDLTFEVIAAEEVEDG